ncbi:c-type cytochrome [Bradyrhizobium sp. BRP22]|uniref:c-type cytochrome n=1 Tax=Bradyrhizobium sp. BRP22 TaxID=2793821 RepID=UPI001CD4FFAA|nr:c-type cytochrome [Bradyrhizobium sp. BRP22]MCA1454200.1 c-type cytochrome [Bradyrhizobium sp. BRP22]
MWSLPRLYVWALALAATCPAATIAAQLAWNSQHQTERVARAMTGGDPSHAPEIMRRYGCTGCHTIPGVAGADGQVGTPLAGLRGRVYIAGVATNSPDNLVRWIVAPQAFSPRTAMPATGITEAEARDVAAYLYAR